MHDPLLLPIPEVARLLNISTAFCYELVGKGTILAVKIGDRRLVSQTWLNDYIKGLEAKAEAELVAAGE